MHDTEATMSTSLALEERPRRRVPQLVDLLVDVRVFGDVRIGARDVRLGLVVVVVRDEVLDRVVREELPELRRRAAPPASGCGASTSVGRWYARDDVGHRERLAGPGDAEQRLRSLAVLQPGDERVDRLRLVAGWDQRCDELERLAGGDWHLRYPSRSAGSSIVPNALPFR